MGSLDDPVLSPGHEDDPGNQRDDGEAKSGGTDEVDESDEGTRNLNMLVSEAE